MKRVNVILILPAMILITNLIVPTASASSNSDWRCKVAIPGSQALVAASNLTLNALVKQVPRAEKALVEQRSLLGKAQSGYAAAAKAAAADPSNVVLADAAKLARASVTARNAGVKAAVATLKATKSAIPGARKALAKAEVKLAELKKTCN